MRGALPFILVLGGVVVACGGADPGDVTIANGASSITDDAGDSPVDAASASSTAKDGGNGGKTGSGGAIDSGTSGNADGGADAGPQVTAAALLALTQMCKTKVSSSPYATDVGAASNVDVCGLVGAVFFHADMDVDCDGKSTATCSTATDPDFQNDTAAQASTGGPLDAAATPFVVVPIASSRWSYTASGLALGSVVAVIYNGKLEFGVIGDLGPKTIIGEASYAMAKNLGIPPSPTSGGVSSGVTYIAFTGPSAKVTKNQDHAEAVQVGTARALDLLAKN
jgi:hypothetical protein